VLKTLDLNGNKLEGPLTIPLSANLSILDVQGNRFCDHLEGSLFVNSPLLELLGISQNCLSVEIPVEICQSSELQFLYMNGLYQVDFCRKSCPQYFNRFSTDISDHCLWTMPSLKSLYLAGNGYRGDLTDTISLPAINQFHIGSNNFHGTLSSSTFNGQSIDVFDISKNKIYGELRINIHPSNVSDPKNIFRANKNRLSGKFLNDVISNYSAGQISVLTGIPFFISLVSYVS
jgi:hypothetical protein